MGSNADRRDVSRLFARAAFGATAVELDRWTGQPYGAVVDHLLDIPDPTLRAPQPDEPRRLVLEQSSRASSTPVAAQIAVETIQRWWLERMRQTPYPLEERMTLLWHDHFATAQGQPYPDTGQLMQQNQTLRRNALGNFRTMVEELTIDPAMLFWLNGNENARGKPNENYARELFELFTLGTSPQIYSEADVREAARALTGWVFNPTTRAVQFSSGRHDGGIKTVLGRTIYPSGNLEYKQVVDVALEQPVAARFIAYKLVLGLAYEPVGDLLADPDPLVVRVADVLRSTDWDLRGAVRALLLDDGFRYADPAAERQMVRQPVDLVVTAARQLRFTLDVADVTTLLTRMGQRLFDPPNVGGWPFQRNWLSPVTMLARYDWGVAAHDLFNRTIAVTPRDPLPPSSNLNAWVARFGLHGLSPNTDQAIRDYIASRPGTNREAERQGGIVVLLASSPDWMVM